jgi:hypothetical protein
MRRFGRLVLVLVLTSVSAGATPAAPAAPTAQVTPKPSALVMDVVADPASGARASDIVGLTGMLCNAISKQPGLELTCLQDVRAALDARALMQSVGGAGDRKLEDRLAATTHVISAKVIKDPAGLALIIDVATRAPVLEAGIMPVPDKVLVQLKHTAPQLAGFRDAMKPIADAVAKQAVEVAKTNPTAPPAQN